MQVGGFTIGGELARGASGVVYVARDREGREVALKVVSVTSDTSRRRFVREVEALRRVPPHPGIVSIVGAGEHEGRSWLAMDLVRGPSLQERLDRGGPLAPRVAVRLGIKLAQALAHAHRSGVLHRDLKPSNVLLEDGEEPLLVDLGLAKDVGGAHSRLTHTGMFLGTPGYWPPEQALGRLAEVSAASDVYALGATVFAALTGRPPFLVDSMAAAMAAAEREAPPRPSALAPGVDAALDAVVLRCLEKDPGRRFASADELAAALEACLTPARRRRRPSHRVPVLAAAASGVVVAAVGVAIGLGPKPTTTPAPAPATEAGPRTTASPSPPPSVDPARQARLDALLAEGERRTAAREHEAAREAFDRALEVDPRSARALRGRGVASIALADRASALADLDRSLALAPDPKTYVARAWLHLWLGRLQDALADCDAASALDGGHAEARSLRAYARWRIDDIPGARADCDAALALNPDDALALTTRGAIRTEEKDDTGARQDLDRALELDSTLASAWYQRGLLRHRQGELQGALADLDEAAKRSPAHAETWASRSAVKGELQDFAGALADAERALELDPRNGMAHLQHGMALLASRGFDEAEAALRRALELAQRTDSQAESRYQLGNAFVMQERYTEALAEYSEALRLQPTHVDVWVRRSFVHERKGDLEGADRDLTAAVDLLPDPVLLRSLAALRLRREDRPGALRAMDEAVRGAPDVADYRIERAALRVMLGDRPGAMQDLDHVLQRDPRNVRALIGRSDLRLAAGERAAGEADLRAVLSLAAPGSDPANDARDLLRRAGLEEP